MSSSSIFSVAFMGLAIAVLAVSGCASKKKSKSTDDPGATEQATYSASIILPLSASSQLGLTADDITSVDVTTFDINGNELEKSTAPVATDADGVSSAEIRVNPIEITIVEVAGEDLGVLIPATSVKPSESVQRPLTETGKNVIDAMKAIAPEHRPYVDPEVIGTLLPAGTKFDPSTMTNMVLAFTEKVKELPDEKRAEVFLKRLEINTDYKAVVKSGGNLDTAQSAEAFSARKLFVTENPSLAERSVIKFLTKPSDVIEKDPILVAKIPDAIREKSSGEALARQILATKVDSSNQRLDTSSLSEMTDAMADVKAAVIVARRGENVGSKEKMTSIIDTIARRSLTFEKPEDIKGEILIAIAMTAPELSTSFEIKRDEVAGMMCTQSIASLFNPVTSECRDAMDGCEASKLRKNGWRDRSRSDLCASESSGSASGSTGGSETSAEPICSQVLTKMFQPRTTECLVATDGCMTDKLKLFGWRERESTDICLEQPATSRICLKIASFMRHPESGVCKQVISTCEKEDLEMIGFGLAKDGECTILD